MLKQKCMFLKCNFFVECIYKIKSDYNEKQNRKRYNLNKSFK